MSEELDWPIEILAGLPFRRHRQRYQGSPYNLSSFEEAGVGDCYRTAIACLIGARTLEEVPHIQHRRNVDEYLAGIELPWHDRRIAREYLRTIGLDLATVYRSAADELGVRYLVSVQSKKGPWLHVVIGHRGEVIFDPSGRDDYTMADAADELCEVICRPYEPDPAAMIVAWLAASRETT